VEKIVFVTVALIDSSFGYAGRLGHGVDRCAVEAELHEHFTGDFDQVLVTPHRLGPGRPTSAARGPMQCRIYENGAIDVLIHGANGVYRTRL
jgi:hypothetical protein